MNQALPVGGKLLKTEIVTTPERSRLMSRIRQKNTSVEKKLGKILEDFCLKYEQNIKELPGSPDFMNQEGKWAIFSHGCFWHAHESCKRWKIPRRNREFWKVKFKRNRERDKKKIEQLEELGYSVLVVWECELVNSKVYEKITNFFSVPFEFYQFSDTKKSVVRIVFGSQGEKHETRMYPKKVQQSEDAHSAFDLAFLMRKTSPKLREYTELVRCVDLYSGCGGLSLGVQEACRAIGKKFVSVAAIEKIPEIMDVYIRNMGCVHPFTQDINQILDGKIGETPTDNEKNFITQVTPVQILLSGPPCQGYSDLNNHTRRDDPRNALYNRVTRFIEIIKPEFVLIENVHTIIHGKNDEVKEAIDTMDCLGYHVDNGIVDCTELGVPQRRRRHILIGSLSKCISIEKTILKYRVNNERPVSWAIDDLNKIKSERFIDKPSKHSKENLKRIRYLISNNLFDLPDELRPKCHRDGDHSYKSMYGRMKPDEPAQTITSGFNSPGQGRFVHPTKLRTITPHEAARLQYFPDFFDFSSVNKKTILTEMIGNAVPMKLSYIFCLELLA